MPKISLPTAQLLPAELVHLKQWVGWKYVTKKNSTKPTKVPLEADGASAHTDLRSTWTTFSNITGKVAKANGRFAGIGFVFSEKDEYAGVDLDNCLMADGSVMEWAKPLLARFADTYAEISPSGRGIKIWCRGRLERGRKIEFTIDGVKCGVEAYSWGRFFTVTGQRWQGAPLSITPHQADIDTALEIAGKLAKPSPAAEAAPGSSPVGEGGRHDALKRMAIKLAKAELTAIEIEAALLAFNAKRCSPPKDEAEIRDIVKWVTEHRFDGAVDPASLPKLAGVDGETVYTTEVKDVLAVAEGFLYPGCTIFNARPKIGKSWLMLQAAIGVTSGSTIAGRMYVRQPGRVLYLALEETEARTTRRMKKLTPQNDFLKDITFIYRKDIEAAASGGVIQIEEYLKTHPGIRLVVIDTLLAFQRIERKKTNDLLLSDYNMIQPLQEMAAKYDVALVIVDHSRKAGGDAIDVLSGSTGKSAAPDAVITLQRQGDGTCLLSVIHRDAEPATYQMKFYGDGDTDHSFGWWVLATGDDAATSTESQEVIDLLKDQELGPAAIARQLGRKEGTIRMRLKRLVERGRVTCHEGKYRAL
jgi:AAA domain/Primase C terminal 1 (PriCT-1)